MSVLLAGGRRRNGNVNTPSRSLTTGSVRDMPHERDDVSRAYRGSVYVRTWLRSLSFAAKREVRSAQLLIEPRTADLMRLNCGEPSREWHGAFGSNERRDECSAARRLRWQNGGAPAQRRRRESPAPRRLQHHSRAADDWPFRLPAALVPYAGGFLFASRDLPCRGSRATRRRGTPARGLLR